MEDMLKEGNSYERITCIRDYDDNLYAFSKTWYKSEKQAK